MATRDTRSISNIVGSKRSGSVSGQFSPSEAQSPTSATSPASYASSSPTEPSTPPTSRTTRSRTRDDSGRVPLHRRGRSKTYETFEDIFAEEGLEPTRIATPDVEAGDAKSGEKHSGMGAVVDFFSQFLPTTNNVSPDEVQTDSSAPSFPPTPSTTTDSYEESTPRPSRIANRSRDNTYQGYALPDRPSQMTLREPSSALRQPRPHYPEGHVVHPRPSRAKLHLRHIASNASMAPSRPSSTPAQIRPSFSIRRRTRDEDDDPSIFLTQRGAGDGEEDHMNYQPPLPPSWLESVARAVLFGGHIGGPSNPEAGPSQPPPQPPQKRPTAPHPLRASRSTLSQKNPSSSRTRTGLSDQTNVPLAPPPLFAMLERGRAGRSESEVTRTRVTCRSAPGSRATSPRRGENGRGRGERRRNGKKLDSDRVPSLARTQTEDDAWNNGQGRPSTANDVRNHYLNGASRMEAEVPDAHVSSEEEDEPEGELDLAQMLVHPRRQDSIRSLRKHLNGAGEGRSSRGLSSARTARSPLNDDEHWPDYGTGWTTRENGESVVNEEEGEAELFERFVAASRLHEAGPSRGEIPNAWGATR
ncbi:hypothetical protein D9611_013226 [Ephemerocybe angulata]|uniref:Uncharacterized protein n=1 Tax=Ephemerocybe angulata TaxID=980116 RepID=A0A8H5BTE3_9AGAR|nr:hypothetical protein D9611_013226 [Tulosesus angulatus]